MTNIINRQWRLAKRPFDDLVQGLGGLAGLLFFAFCW